MIKRIITVKAKSGKLMEARELVKELNDLINKKNPWISGEVYTEKYGEVGTIYALAQFENIGQLEETMAASRDDPEIQSLMAKGIDLFAENSGRITLLESF